jgi:hypothetical protein
LSDSRKSERYGPVNEDVHLSFWDKIKGIFGPDKPKSPLTSPFSEREGVSTQIESSSTSQLSEQERSCDGLKPAGLSSTDTSVDPLSTDTELDRPSTSQL